MIKVYHATQPTFASCGDQPSWPDAYKLVARVDSLCKEVAFEKTNHITHAWWENTEVELVGESSQRSTSVGDVMVSDDEAWRVLGVGYEQIQEEE